jgi:hypothetical protein
LDVPWVCAAYSAKCMARPDWGKGADRNSQVHIAQNSRDMNSFCCCLITMVGRIVSTLSGETFFRSFASKIRQLVSLLAETSNIVAHTGAGISTASGVPDFRGPRGVWTCQDRGLPPPDGVAFGAARPSVTHRALFALMRAGRMQHIVSQNVDALHLRSGVPRSKLSELHGNVCMEKCTGCATAFLRDDDVGGMGRRPTGLVSC